VPGGGSPSQPQAAKVYEAITPAMARAGFQFANSIETADYVLTVTFTPNPLDPPGGHVAVNGLERGRHWRSNVKDDTSERLKEVQSSVQDLDRWTNAHSPPDPR